jgi:uncharacterized OsmC-like protein
VKTGQGALRSDIRGEVETEDGVLVIRRITVHHRLTAPENAQATVDAVHREYAPRCPLYRTLHRCIEITSTYELVPSSS